MTDQLNTPSATQAQEESPFATQTHDESRTTPAHEGQESSSGTNTHEELSLASRPSSLVNMSQSHPSIQTSPPSADIESPLEASALTILKSNGNQNAKLPQACDLQHVSPQLPIK